MTWTFPIKVERFTGTQAFVCGCNGCGKQTNYAGEENAVDAFMAAAEYGRCPHCGEGPGFVAAYEEASRCRNCGRLEYDLSFTGVGKRRYCSVPCRLQGDYAARLEMVYFLSGAEKALYEMLSKDEGLVLAGLPRRLRDAAQRLRRKGLAWGSRAGDGAYVWFRGPVA